MWPRQGMLWLATRFLLSRNKALISPGIRSTGCWQLPVEFSRNCPQLKGPPLPKVGTSSYCYWHLMMRKCKEPTLVSQLGTILRDNLNFRGPHMSPEASAASAPQFHFSPNQKKLSFSYRWCSWGNSPINTHMQISASESIPSEINLRQARLTERLSWFQRC